MLRRRAMMNVKKGHNLPSEYQEVTWIRYVQLNTRAFYLPYHYNIDYDTYELDFKVNNVTDIPNGGFIGTSNYDGLSKNGEKFRTGTSQWGIRDIQTITDNTEYTFVYRSGSVDLICEGIKNTYSATSYQRNYGIGIYGIGQNAGSQTYKWDFKQLRFYINGEMTHLIVPCYVKSDKSVKIYDVITNSVYSPAVNNFICGDAI